MKTNNRWIAPAVVVKMARYFTDTSLNTDAAMVVLDTTPYTRTVSPLFAWLSVIVAQFLPIISTPELSVTEYAVPAEFVRVKVFATASKFESVPWTTRGPFDIVVRAA